MAWSARVRPQVAAASAAAWLASGERSVLRGIDLGSETMFMPRFYAAPDGRSTVQTASITSLRQMAVMRQIAEPGQAGFELQFNRAGRAVALFADDDFGLAMNQRHVQLPFFVFRRARAGLFI